MRNFSEFLKIVFSDWVGRMSGGFSSAISFWLLLSGQQTFDTRLYWSIAGALAVFCSYRAWLKEHTSHKPAPEVIVSMDEEKFSELRLENVGDLNAYGVTIRGMQISDSVAEIEPLIIPSKEQRTGLAIVRKTDGSEVPGTVALRNWLASFYPEDEVPNPVFICYADANQNRYATEWRVRFDVTGRPSFNFERLLRPREVSSILSGHGMMKA